MPRLICPQCGAGNRARARFCDCCGQALRLVAGSVIRLLQDDELKYVTVLFADIVNSTALVADVLPDEAQVLLTPAVKVMLDAVREFGGTINRVIGDGVLAFFGFPHSQEDHALRACCAAQRMHEEAAQLGAPASLRIGVASGVALLSADDEAAIGTPIAFGVTVHLAARLQGMTRPGSSLCSAETKNLVGPAVEMLALGRRLIRGLPIEQDLFEVIRVRQGQRFHLSTAAGVSPYVGRTRELALLQTCADSAQAGRAMTVAIVGDAGAGKSRLAWQFTRALVLEGWQVVRAEAISYGRDIPYLLVAALVRSCFGIDEHDSAAEYASKVGVRLPEMVEDDRVLKTALLSLLDLPLGDGEEAWEALDPLRRREALHESIGAVVRAVARRAATVVLIEDLHWSDQESVRVLDAAARSSGSLLLLATYRSDFEPGWSHPSLTIVNLEPLSHGAMVQLLEGAFPELLDGALQKELIERAAGNPFFLEEMTRSVLACAPDTGGADTPRPLRIPATIEAVLAERIDRLDSDAKRVLRAASALGSRFPHLVLQTMFGDQPTAAFQGQLAQLRTAGLLRRDKFADGEDGFAHALIQEVTYNGLPRQRRRDLHAVILRTISAIDTEYVAEQAETLAFHALRGEVWDAVAVHARRAGQRAAGRSAYREAAAFFEQAIAAYEHLPISQQALAEQIDLRFELRNALFPTSSIGRSLVYSQQAESLALQLGDNHRLGWATAFHARDLTLLGRPSQALHVARRALDVAGADDDMVAIIQSYIALAAYYRGDYEQSATTLRTLVKTVERRDRMQRLGLPGPAAVFFRGWLAWALARVGRAEEAEAIIIVMRQLAEESTQPLCVTVAHLGWGFTLTFAGRLEEARDVLQAGVDLCRRWEFFGWFTNIASCLGHVLSRLGESAAGIDLLQQAIVRTKASGILVSHAHELAWLAEAFDKKGDHAEAVRQAEAAIAVAQSHEERGNEALARVVLAEALINTGGTQESLIQFRSSLAAAAECRMAPLILRCQAGLSVLEEKAHSLA